MVKSMVCIVLAQFLLAALLPLSMCYRTHECTSAASLSPWFYDNSCPKAQAIVQFFVAKAYSIDPRMAASLLRLHFHDCFVNGCDASVLLDSSGTIESEKRSTSNRDSARGFEVIDEIKSALEYECPETVSCADILALVARDSVVISGGPTWEVYLGRRDAREASLSGSMENIPFPDSTLQTIVNMFNLQGLDLTDLVALLGSHTIGNSRCLNFRQRLYNHSGNNDPDQTLNQNYAYMLQQGCPISGEDQKLFNLDYVTPTKFDNYYFKNLVDFRGLLNSDEVLFTQSSESMEMVKLYAENEEAFFEQFAKSIVKMGNISPLSGTDGEIRKICRRVNHDV
ncbi:PREDICTED: peroxidase 36-like [Camelina sativa]|uniref:Peroxidase n=1 Tax=Camelina sativa TaxID=90675 RepID=A0ABM0YNW3_CAMSA|nr:PREDICTED: peroxidase 36-like [Camelina sativa]